MNQEQYLASIAKCIEPVAVAVPVPTLDPRVTSAVPLPTVQPVATGTWTTDVRELRALLLPEPEPIPEPVSVEDCIEGLTAKQTQAIDCLISGMNQIKTGETVGVTRRTINDWNKKPEFRKVLRVRRKEALQASMNILQAASVELASNLVRLAKTSFDPADQIRATVQALKFANEQVFVEEITDRLDAIESSRNAPVTNGATYTRIKGGNQ